MVLFPSSGWGEGSVSHDQTTTFLQAADVKIISRDECKQRLKEFRNAIGDKDLCAFSTTKAETCK